MPYLPLGESIPALRISVIRRTTVFTESPESPIAVIAWSQISFPVHEWECLWGRSEEWRPLLEFAREKKYGRSICLGHGRFLLQIASSSSFFLLFCLQFVISLKFFLSCRPQSSKAARCVQPFIGSADCETRSLFLSTLFSALFNRVFLHLSECSYIFQFL